MSPHFSRYRTISGWLANNSRAVSGTLIGTLLAVLGLHLLTATVAYQGTDLWFHMAGGRALFENGAPANPIERSYLPLEGEYINYAWGFQAFTYLIWSIGEYPALIIARALLVFLIAYLVIRIVLQDRPMSAASPLQFILVMLVVYLLTTRGFTLRPHYFSYLFIAFFLYTLKYRRNWFPTLPIATVAWINLHGIEWIIGALICGGWTLDRIAAYWRTRDTRDLDGLPWVLACLPALLINPFGHGVLLTPLLTPPGDYGFIREFQEFSLAPSALFLGFNNSNVAILLILAFAMSVGIALRARIASVTLWLPALGGTVLFFQGGRFIHEWILLSLPLVAASLGRVDPGRHALATTVPCGILLVLMAQAFYKSGIDAFHRYPFDANSLPSGTTRFIEQAGLGGKYTVPTSYAGFIEWRLPRVKYHMILQFPPFSIENYETLVEAQRTPQGLAALVENHAPDLIAVVRENEPFREIVKTQPQYVSVFFDDVLVLYVDRNAHPAIGDRYRLRHVDPFDASRTRADRFDDAVDELDRMLAIAPDSIVLKTTLAANLVYQGELERAKEVIDQLLERFPNNASTLYYNGVINQSNEHFDDAIASFNRFLIVSDDPGDALTRLGHCYFAVEDFKAAYESFNRAVRETPSRAVSDPIDQYLFAFSAVAIGETARARELIAAMEQKGIGNENLRTQVAALKELIEGIEEQK